MKAGVPHFGDKVKERGSSLREDEAVDWTRQICSAVAALHGREIIHRDIKPENIFVNKGVYKLGDFGFAREVIGTFSTQLGTCLYMAPEFYNNGSLTSKVDVWAVGCMFHQ